MHNTTSSAPGTPTKAHAQPAVSRWTARNPFFWTLLGLLWLDLVCWLLLQVILAGWNPSGWQLNLIQPNPQAQGFNPLNDSEAYYLSQAYSLPNFLVRALIVPAVTISMVHAEREYNLAAAFVSFTCITVNTLSWIIINLPLNYAILSSSGWAHPTLCGAITGFIFNSWCQLVKAQAAFSCIHFGVLVLLWFYSFHQMARNHRMNPMRTWLALDRFNAAIVVLALIGYLIWSVSSAYLGTRSADFNGPLTGSTTLVPYLHTGIFFGLVLAAYVCFGAGKRLFGTALALIWASAFTLLPVFIMECRRMYQFKIQEYSAAANPPNSGLLAACGPGTGYCTAAMSTTAGLGLLTGAMWVLSVTVWIAYFRAPDDATPAETHAVPGNVYTGPGYQNNQVPNTYKGNDLESQAFINNGGVAMAPVGAHNVAGQYPNGQYGTAAAPAGLYAAAHHTAPVSQAYPTTA